MAEYKDSLVVYLEGSIQKIHGDDSVSLSGDFAVGGNVTTGSIVGTDDLLIDVGSGQLLAQRGDPVSDPVFGLTGEGAAFLLQGSAQTSEHKALVYGSDGVRVASGANLSVNSIAGNLSVFAAGLASILGDSLSIEASGGNITVGGDNENGDINIGTGGQRVVYLGSESSPVMLGADGQHGSIGVVFNSTSGIVTGNVLCLINSNGNPVAAAADSDSAGSVLELVGVALEDENGSGKVKAVTVPGSVVKIKFVSGGTPSSPSEIGQPVYLSTTAGEVTMVSPVVGRVCRIGVLYDDTAVSSGIYKVLYLPNMVADLGQ